MNHLDGFSGYGGFSLAFEQANWKLDKTYFSEIDKYAIANYKKNFPNAIYAGSITDIPTSGIIKKLDLFTFGWPCQDNSIAGKRKGQTAGTRSGLLYSAVKIINKYKPRIFVAENVEGLRSVNKGLDIIESLKVLAYLSESNPQYDVEMQLLNTRWYLPQNRERLFFIGHLRDGSSRQIFPIGESDFGNEIQEAREYEARKGFRSEYSRTITKRYGKDGAECLIVAQRGREGGQQLEESKGDYSNTLTSVHKDNLIITDNLYANRQRDYENESQVNHIRRLTPIEVERLQGLPDNWTKYGNFDGIVKEISDSQRYKLVGNGVSIPPVKMIAEKLKKIYDI